MRLRATIAAGALFASLLALPISGARFTDTTSNDGNTFSFGTAQPIRSTTYRVKITDSYSALILNQDLAENYFVLLRGSADPDDASTESEAGAETEVSEETASLTSGADADYVRVVGDPSGRPGNTTAKNVLEFGRYSDTGTWWGQVTVVESLDLHDTAGFRLTDVSVVRMAPKRKMAAAPGLWTNESQVALYGGSMGGGMTVDGADHANGWARIWPEDGRIRLRRSTAAAQANLTIYAVEWGSEWTIQHVRVQGHNGGSGVDSAKEYNATALDISVASANTFVLAYGSTMKTAAGTGWEGQIYTLGDGVGPLSEVEDRVAVGGELREKRDAEVYVHTHPRLHVDHRFGPHGSISAGTDVGFAKVNAPLARDVRIGPSTGTLRFPILSNSSTGTNTDGPQPIIWSRHTGPTTVTWARNETVNSGAYWLQSVDFGEIWR